MLLPTNADGSCQGFAYCTYRSSDTAAAAFIQLSEATIDGTALQVALKDAPGGRTAKKPKKRKQSRGKRLTTIRVSNLPGTATQKKLAKVLVSADGFTALRVGAPRGCD